MNEIDQKYVVYHNDKVISVVNPRLLEKQHAEDNLEKIKQLHCERFHLYKKMNSTKSVKNLRKYGEQAFQIEKHLQILWNFDIDTSKIRFWRFPQCKCPSIDNDERYGCGNFIIDYSCPLHGKLK